MQCLVGKGQMSDELIFNRKDRIIYGRFRYLH